MEYHNGGASEYSWVEILFQAGLILGSILLMASKRQGSMKSVIISGMMLSVVLLGLSLVPRGWFWLFFIICFLMGINLAYIDTQLISVLQTTIPKDLQGRVFATMFTLIKAMNPVGLIILGMIGEMVPVIWLFLISPSISLVVYFLLIKFTKMMHYDENTGNEELNTNEIDLMDDTEFRISNIPKEELKTLVE
ncbi:MAG: MFS transporter [Candidatus Lokiarchaeota archaeon]|nr:MFS transporter [Candidatus Harpocratesius repetitus]